MSTARAAKLQCLYQGQIWLSQVTPARHFWPRLKGLLGRNGLEPGEGLLLEPCNAIHTLGMRFPIGVIYLNQHNHILRVIPHLPPGKIGPTVWGARRVLECASEAILPELQNHDQLVFHVP